jgi:Protein of unknown function (DUF1275)
MSTTYLTGLLTALAISHWPAEWQRSVGVLIAIVVGAGLGAVTAMLSPLWVPAVVLAPLAAVVVFKLAARRDRPVVTREGCDEPRCGARRGIRPAATRE